MFFIINIKIHSFTSLTGVGWGGGAALQGNFSTGVQLILRKHPIGIYYYQMKPEFTFTCLTFSTTLTPGELNAMITLKTSGKRVG